MVTENDKPANSLEQATGSPGSVRLVVTGPSEGKTRDHVIPAPFAIVGRSAKCDVRLKSPDVSFRHAYLQFIGGRILCVDLHSRNGTHWEDGPKQADWLTSGRCVRIGPYSIRLAGNECDSEDPLCDFLPNFHPLEKYSGELGPLPHMEIEFLNGSTQRRLWRVNSILTLIGRAPSCKLCFETQSVSAVHCSLLLTPSGLWVVDLLGRGGAKVNHRRVLCARLTHGAKLKVGGVCMRIRSDSPQNSDDTSQSPETCESLIERVMASGLLSHEEIGNVRTKWDVSTLTRENLLSILTDEKMITPWQARQIISPRGRQLVLEGRYTLRERLGAGGMGTVYRAFDAHLRRDVAIKFPTNRTPATSLLLKRFRREAVISRKLQHPNIVRALEVGRGGRFLVLEYIAGENLKRLLKRSGARPPAVAVNYIAQVTEALEVACQNGIIHRDIKPSNILVTPDGTVKLLDLGLARLKTDGVGSLDDGDESLEQLTHAGIKLGTVRYMAPEQAQDSRLADTRSDIYSVGCTLYELLAGSPPFEAESPVKILLKHAREPVPPIPGLDDKLAAVLRKALAKDPADRFQTPSELLNRLRDWQHSTGNSRHTPGGVRS
jgi:serine/threonine-protein kinase